MGSPSTLVEVYRSFASDSAQLLVVFRGALAGGFALDNSVPAFNRAAAWYCLIGLHDAWARFCKQVVLFSAKGSIVTRSGNVVPRSPEVNRGADPETALQMIVAARGGYWPRFGPAWYDPSECLKMARYLNVQNYTELSAGLGIRLLAPRELRCCRNYLAHRHLGTAKHGDVLALQRRLGLPAYRMPPAELPAVAVSGGVSLYESWSIDLRSMALAAIE